MSYRAGYMWVLHLTRDCSNNCCTSLHSAPLSAILADSSLTPHCPFLSPTLPTVSTAAVSVPVKVFAQKSLLG